MPAWNTGNEVEQGTSVAAPHAAGLAALLVSGTPPERRPISAREIRQALMVTAQPTPGATIVDEGAGLADVDRAYRWLASAPSLPEIQVREIGRAHV